MYTEEGRTAGNIYKTLGNTRNPTAGKDTRRAREASTDRHRKRSDKKTQTEQTTGEANKTKGHETATETKRNAEARKPKKAQKPRNETRNCRDPFQKENKKARDETKHKQKHTK